MTCFSLALCPKASGPIALLAVTQNQNPLYMDTLGSSESNLDNMIVFMGEYHFHCSK